MMKGLLLLSLIILNCTFAFIQQLQTSQPYLVRNQIRQNFKIKSELRAKFSKVTEVNDEEVSDEEGNGSQPREKMVSIPYQGLAQYEPGAVFRRPLEVYEFDPLKELEQLDSKDMEDSEKIDGLFDKIQERVDELKKQGLWESDMEGFGRDPLATQPLYLTMLMQTKSLRPFESFGELVLTYSLVIITSVVLSAYLVYVREWQESAMGWYIKTDFDADFLSNLFTSK